MVTVWPANCCAMATFANRNAERIPIHRFIALLLLSRLNDSGGDDASCALAFSTEPPYCGVAMYLLRKVRKDGETLAMSPMIRTSSAPRMKWGLLLTTFSYSAMKSI